MLPAEEIGDDGRHESGNRPVREAEGDGRGVETGQRSRHREAEEGHDLQSETYAEGGTTSHAVRERAEEKAPRHRRHAEGTDQGGREHGIDAEPAGEGHEMDERSEDGEPGGGEEREENPEGLASERLDDGVVLAVRMLHALRWRTRITIRHQADAFRIALHQGASALRIARMAAPNMT